MVSEHPLATRAGVSILDAGGNAADAAVATALALAVAYPQAGNLGGGGFGLWVPHDPGDEARLLDFRETAPQELSSADFLDQENRFVAERSLSSHLAVGVPGSPEGLWRFQQELGRLPFSMVIEPALRLAREGFEVDLWLADALRDPTNRARLQQNAMAGTIFYPRGQPLRPGDLLRQENLALTLELLAREGPGVFYRGEIADAIVAEMNRGGGRISSSDLARYGTRWRTPLRGWYRGHEVLTAPPPSSGGLVLLQVLSLLDGFPLDEERKRTLDAGEGDDSAPGEGMSGRAAHWWIESLRRSFADRAEHLGDPDYHTVPEEELLSPSWIASRRISIGELAIADVRPMELAPPTDGETTHISVLDSEGNAVSMTTTLNTSFGSGIMVPGAGFLLNNEIDDFAILPSTPNAYGLVGSGANALQPGKRPLSSMTPVVIRDGGQTVRMVLGSPGGPKIITAVIQVILRSEIYGQSLFEAVAAPRLHQQWNPPTTFFEPGWPPAVLQDLRNRGHRIEVQDQRFGSVQAIRVDVGGDPVAVSDARRGGVVGYEGGEIGVPSTPPERDLPLAERQVGQGTD